LPVRLGELNLAYETPYAYTIFIIIIIIIIIIINEKINVALIYERYVY